MHETLKYLEKVEDLRQKKKILHKMSDIIGLVFFAMVSPEFLEKFQMLWNEMLNGGEGEKIKKILAIDGKTQCGNKGKDKKANHIVSAVDENGICIG